MKKYTENEMKFEELPENVQREIKKCLHAFPECNVTFENGKFTVSTGVSLKAQYAADHKFIGVFYVEDIFTEEEQIINYAEAFHAFSPLYKGKRDYTIWKQIGYDWTVKFKLENGNLVIA